MMSPRSPAQRDHVFLDAMRMQGDPPADDAVARVVAEGGPGALCGMMRRLFERSGGDRALHPAVRELFDAAAASRSLLGRGRLSEAEQLYRRHRPEIRIALGGYSLPAAYAARKGAQVLHRTACLLEAPARRLFETARFVDEVMAPGALLPGGPGLGWLLRVRLVHAATRHRVLHDASRPWDVAELGVPINQEDLAGTLMTFSFVVLEGLEKLGIALAIEAREAWLDAWRVAGRALGIDAKLIPVDVADAGALTSVIRERQVASSPEGKALTRALVQSLEDQLPPLMKGLPASLMHFFLDAHRVDGRRVVDMLNVPPADWTVALPVAFKGFNGLVGWASARAPVAGRALDRIRGSIAAQLVLPGLDGPRPRRASSARRQGAGETGISSALEQVT
jgi:ER-bound oxygenase mpaB/B'/Rubber oxygenase, catalytic domain